MEKRLFNPAIFILILIGLSSAVIAAHTATVTLSPTSGYETVKKTFLLNIQNNVGSTDSINTVYLALNGYTINEIAGVPFGWYYWNNGSFLILNTSSNMIGPLPLDAGRTFMINATAQQVSGDSPSTWFTTTFDTGGSSRSNILTVTILNDLNPPNITNIIPSDYSFVKNETVNFTITVNEAETSIPDPFYIGYDDNNLRTDNGTILDYLTLTKSSDSAYYVIWNPDQSLFPYIDYRIINLSDAAGNSYNEGINFPHHLYIDNQKPSVVLNQLDNNFLTNNMNQSFNFNASDNSFVALGQGFAPDLNCSLYVNNVNMASTVLLNDANNVNFNVSLGLVDGTYPWYVSCIDKAGWAAQSETRNVILDTTGPVIILNAPADGSIILNGTQIALTITDVPAGVDSRWYNNGSDIILFTSTIDTSNWSEGINNIVVYANDTLNNINELELNFTVDKTGPVINLVEPFNNSIINSNGNFVFNATDNYDSVLTCNLFMDGFNISTIGGNSGQNTIISDDLGLTGGDHSWYVSCMDDVTLTTNSEVRNVSVDATPPQINNLADYLILNDTNDNDGVISFSLSITDINGISSCEAYVNNTLVQINSTPDFSFNIIASNNPYTIQAGCNDTVDNWLALPEIQIYYDNIAPVISGVLNSSITDTSVTITWDTGELSDSNLTLNGVTSLNNNSVLNHNILINGLTQLTQYIYNVTSRDRWNNTASVLNLNFNTTATPPSPPSPGSSSSGDGGDGGSSTGENITFIENNTVGGIERKPAEQPKENKTLTTQPEDQEIPGITGLAIMDNIKYSIPLAIIAAIIVAIILIGLHRITLSPVSRHRHINLEYRENMNYKTEDVKDEDIFND